MSIVSKLRENMTIIFGHWPPKCADSKGAENQVSILF
jgi:hypothetical protein